ncbi:MAG: hypothetical protein WKF83_11050 [Nocardioidaceae bacterium]
MTSRVSRGRGLGHVDGAVAGPDRDVAAQTRDVGGEQVVALLRWYVERGVGVEEASHGRGCRAVQLGERDRPGVVGVVGA